jgi:hypothetical protein
MQFSITVAVPAQWMDMVANPVLAVASKYPLVGYIEDWERNPDECDVTFEASNSSPAAVKQMAMLAVDIATL